jgi:predicted transcriptional regulator of viral defense system
MLMCENQSKGGGRMKYYESLVDLKCFTRADVEHLTQNRHTADSLIKEYKRKGYIESVRRNLFVVVSMETKRAIANRYLIASNLIFGNHVSHHSAFEYYGFANQVFNVVYVSGNGRFAPFEYDDVVFHHVESRIPDGVVQLDDGVRLTDIERTVLDSIHDFEKIGGLEELLRCLSLIPHVDEEKLLLYLEVYDKQILYQKSGYILEHFKNPLRLSSHFFETCKNRRKGSVRYLYHGIMHESHVYDRQWNLVVPRDLLKILTIGGNDDAEV